MHYEAGQSTLIKARSVQTWSCKVCSPEPTVERENQLLDISCEICFMPHMSYPIFNLQNSFYRVDPPISSFQN